MKKSRGREGTTSVLVVDDEPDLCRLLEFNLRALGLEVTTTQRGAAALELADAVNPDLVVLDVMLPDKSGLEICRELRAHPMHADVGVLMLTARGAVEDRVTGLQVGADDYVAKPFDIGELTLRVQALARRCGEQRAAKRLGVAGEVLTFEAIVLDEGRQSVTVDGTALELRPMEFRLLATMMRRPDIVLDHDWLLREVWGIRGDINTRTVHAHVQRLRQRLGEHARHIETVHGRGYRLRKG